VPGDAGQQRVIGLFFLLLECLPVVDYLSGILHLLRAEDMRVTMNQLVIDAPDNILDGELTSLSSNLSLQDNMQEKVAEFLAKLRGIAFIEGFQHLIALLEEAIP
jgi:hypothetical protein